MNFPLYIARRYLRSASRSNAINIINGIAAIGIVVGAMALFVVLSVFSGLRDFSLSFSNDFDPDLKILPKTGKSFVVSAREGREILEINDVAASSKVLEERVLFMFNGKEMVAWLKGADSLFPKVNDVKKILYQGDWPEPNTSQVVIGYGIARKLSLGLLDFSNPFEVYVPKAGKGLIESPEQAFKKFDLAPVAIYAISEELDEKYVFADLGLAQALLDYKPDQVSGIELRLKPNADESEIRSRIQRIFHNKISVKSRAQLNDSLYKMLNTENIAVYLIFTLVIVIALFNLIGALIMMILDKKSNIRTLYNLGSEIRKLRRIFLLQGTLLTIMGGIIGLILGILFVFLQQKFSFIMITPTLAYPVAFSVWNLLTVLITIISLGFIASWIASSRISRKLLQ